MHLLSDTCRNFTNIRRVRLVFDRFTSERNACQAFSLALSDMPTMPAAPYTNNIFNTTRIILQLKYNL